MQILPIGYSKLAINNRIDDSIFDAMNNSEGQTYRLGILGGGQLGRMLIQAGINYDLEIHSLDPDPEAPASTISSSFRNGSFNDYETVLEFGKDKDIITVEIENVNTSALKKLELDGKKVFPQSHVLDTIKDKGLQKDFFFRSGIPTAAYTLTEKRGDLNLLTDDWFPCFQKLRTTGYDGKGVKSLKSRNDIAIAFDEPSVIEKAVDIKKEIAVLVASNGKGEIKTFPPVDMLFHPDANLVEFLSSPSTLEKSILEEASNIACSIAEKIQIQGLLAVEFFVNKQNQILVNELAPRPHNSGHHTIEANRVSQFDQHLRAILGWPLGDTSPISPSVMINILGEPGYNGRAIYQGLEEIISYPGVYVHLYGKKITKAFRKMGHVTITHENLEEAIQIAKKIQVKLKVISTK